MSTNNQIKTSDRKSISIVLPCFNESDNIDELHERLTTVVDSLSQYKFRFLYIDNASTDNTVEKIRELSQRDPRVTAIVNARNFGHIRSPFYGLLEADGDCAIIMASDLQDPPELIPKFIEQWTKGNSIVVGQKTSSDESRLFYLLRTLYYWFVRKVSDIPMLEHVTGFGLYDRRVLETFRSIKDPYPYARGMITEIGLPLSLIPYHQPNRKRGFSKNNFLTFLDLGILAITNYTRLPLRLATIVGFILSVLSLLVAVAFLILKLLFWENLPAGYAPAVIGVFFLGSAQIFLLGVVGEYVGAVLTHVKKRPLVIEKERIGDWP